MASSPAPVRARVKFAMFTPRSPSVIPSAPITPGTSLLRVYSMLADLGIDIDAADLMKRGFAVAEHRPRDRALALVGHHGRLDIAVKTPGLGLGGG